MEKKLYRDEYNKKLGGVCAGLAEYFDMDPTVLRLLFAVAFFLGGTGFMLYIILWIVLPKKNNYNFVDYNNAKSDYKVDYTVPPATPGQPTDPFTSMPYKPKSNAGVIFGIVLILLGGIFLMDQLDIIPDWDYGRLWPVPLIAVGITLIATGRQKKPWEHHDWTNTTVKSDVPKTTDNSTNDNPTPTV